LIIAYPWFMLIRSLNSLINELEKWRIEKRLVCAALLILDGPQGGASLWVKGEIEDTSGLRLVIAGWGRASFMLAGARFGAKVSEELKASIDSLQGGPPVNWGEAIPVTLGNGNLLILWKA
jgi:hypothetical protein